MIPVLLLVGLLAGRWYVVGLAAVTWPLVLVLAGVTGEPASLLAGAALAAVNTLVGVAAHRVLVCLARRSLSAARSCRNRRLVG
ncbi:MAG: hypothetical protein WD027_03005 [Gaiellales bacterium]